VFLALSRDISSVNLAPDAGPSPGGEYVVNVNVYAPPGNDQCANAMQLLSGGETVQGSLNNASADVDTDAQCTIFGTPGPDVFYRVTVPVGASVHAELESLADPGAVPGHHVFQTRAAGRARMMRTQA